MHWYCPPTLLHPTQPSQHSDHHSTSKSIVFLVSTYDREQVSFCVWLTSHHMRPPLPPICCECQDFLLLYGLKILSCICGPHFLYPSIWESPQLTQSSAIVNAAWVNMGVQVSLVYADLIIFEQIPGHRIAGSWFRSILRFLRNLQHHIGFSLLPQPC
jgi:hypothetical protein